MRGDQIGNRLGGTHDTPETAIVKGQTRDGVSWRFIFRSCARSWVSYVGDLHKVPELIRRSHLLIKPRMILVKFHNNAVMLAGIVTPHQCMRWVFTQTEYAKQLPEGFLKPFPLSLPQNRISYALQHFGLVSPHLCHELLAQRRISSNHFTEHLNRNG
jgi:hypothetical protein